MLNQFRAICEQRPRLCGTQKQRTCYVLGVNCVTMDVWDSETMYMLCSGCQLCDHACVGLRNNVRAMLLVSVVWPWMCGTQAIFLVSVVWPCMCRSHATSLVSIVWSCMCRTHAIFLVSVVWPCMCGTHKQCMCYVLSPVLCAAVDLNIWNRNQANFV
jgi:hypothetical protein